MLLLTTVANFIGETPYVSYCVTEDLLLLGQCVGGERHRI